MKRILYSLVMIYTLIGVMLDKNKEFMSTFVVIMLTLLILIIIKERFLNRTLFLFINYIFIIVLVFYYPLLLSKLLAIVLIDIIYQKQYKLLIVLSSFIIYLNYQNIQFELLFFYLLVGLLSFNLIENLDKKQFYLNLIDNERRIRYELEHAKRQLLQNNKEIERLTEIKERNRIARNIHDNIGHDIAGVLFQLQAADKLFYKNQEKSNSIINLCINKLGDSLKIIRETVYNIKPCIELNDNIFKDIIQKFVYCPINFHIDGDISTLSPVIIEVMVTNLKEVLTNGAKHSGATQIEIKIEVTKTFVRFYYHDNGKGCLKIDEGLGLSGIKERINSVNGMINIDGQNGFSIITVIPTRKINIFNKGGIKDEDCDN
ncbi:hypothetical protein KHQ81_07945 [Mycoplasmatota bacterium]|nr:hypothetical protein KHQ81_07945 [Mycoplasmatota bacterium]